MHVLVFLEHYCTNELLSILGLLNLIHRSFTKLKVILYSYLILKKMNERIKTKYMPSYIFENEGKIYKKLKAEIAEVKRVSGKFTMFKY